jgi:alanine dehydrogenase
MVEVLVLAEKDIDQFLGMEEAIEAVEGSLAEYDSGATLMPHKLHLDIPKTGGFMRVMPAAIPKIGFAGVKMYLDPSYAKVSSPASFMLFDIRSGMPVALFGANRLSQIRTGAASAVATKYLARKGSRVAGIFGSGRHARTQLEGTCAVRRIEEAKVYSPTREHRESFASEMSTRLGIKVAAVDSPHSCAESAEVLNLATTTKTPVIREDDVEEGMHINTIGSSFPGRSEIEPRAFLGSKVVVDCKEQALGGVEGSELAGLIGKGLMKPSDIYAEIGEVINGRMKGRTSEKEVTLFKNTGMAIWDVACAARVYEKARKEKDWKRIEI